MAIIYKGSSCLICGYNRFIGALDFHHLDPAEKDFGLSTKGITRAWALVKQELDKTVLLCSNCHREVHGGVVSLEDFLSNNPSPEDGDRFMKEAMLPGGRLDTKI
jgi:hypothetical protein